MAYINDGDYQEYMRSPPPEGFVPLAIWASEQIDAETGYKLRGELKGLSLYVVQQVKKAACLQVKWLDDRGGMNALTGSNLSSVTLGKFSASMGGDGGTNGAASLCPPAKQCLLPTGLLYAGVRMR